jgi:hypothetical protein
MTLAVTDKSSSAARKSDKTHSQNGTADCELCVVVDGERMF